MRPKEKKLKKHSELCGARFFLISMDDFMNFNDFVFAVLHFFSLRSGHAQNGINRYSHFANVINENNH